MQSRADYRCRIRCHAQPGTEYDLRPHLVGLTRKRAMDGGGAWAASLKATPGGFVEEVLQRYVRDDDWVDLRLHAPNDPAASPFTGLVDDTRYQERVDPQTGAVSRSWSVTGRDWSKCLTGGQVRRGILVQGVGTKQVLSESAKSVSPTPWPAGSTGQPSPTYETTSGRALKWILFRDTGTADAADFATTIINAWSAIRSPSTPSGTAHYIVTQAGEIYELCDVRTLRKNIAYASGTDDLDREAVIVAVVGSGSMSPPLAQVAAIGNLCRYLSNTYADLDLAHHPTLDGGSVSWRWGPGGAVAPAGGLVGRNEVYTSPVWPDPWPASTWESVAEAVAGVATVANTTTLPEIPGIISESRWAKVLESVMPKAYDPTGRASAAFRALLTELLPGLWLDPDGADLLSRLSWRRFGPVDGIPWRTVHALGAQPVVTPDALFRQLACEPYNEVFYDYDGDKPAIVYRPRPYGLAQGFAAAYEIDAAHITGIDFTRSGAERCNYWRNTTALSIARQGDVTIDTSRGQSPIFDTDSIRRHGIRVADPTDDFFPPLGKGRDEDILSYYRRRIGTFREWYYHAPEMLTGAVFCKPALPGLRLGQVAKIPVPWWFNAETRAPAVYGYVVEINDSLRVNSQTGAVTTECSFAFIRGQPPGGLAAPAAVAWK